MAIKFIGALLIVVSCGVMGYQTSFSYLREISYFKDLIWILDFMQRQLQCHLTPLPLLCRLVYKENKCKISEVFLNLADILDSQTSNSVLDSMNMSIEMVGIQPDRVKNVLLKIGKILGKFDIDGQIKGIETVKEECIAILKSLSEHQRERSRSIKTIGICAGVAIAILLI